MGILYKCSGENCPMQYSAVNPDCCQVMHTCPYYSPIPTEKPWFEVKNCLYSLYESPIHLSVTPPVISDLMRGQIAEVLSKYEIDIDEEELVKLLRNDRDQYRKGFEDGKNYMLNRLKEVIANESSKVDES